MQLFEKHKALSSLRARCEHFGKQGFSGEEVDLWSLLRGGGVDGGRGGGGDDWGGLLGDGFFDGLFTAVDDLDVGSVGDRDGDGLGGDFFLCDKVAAGTVTGQVEALGVELGPRHLHHFFGHEAFEGLDGEDVPVLIHQEAILVFGFASGLDALDEPGPRLAVRVGWVAALDQHSAIHDGVVGRFDAAGGIGGGGALGGFAGGGASRGFFVAVGGLAVFFAAHEGEEAEDCQN